MAFSYVGNSSGAGTGVTSLTFNKPTGVAAQQFIVAVFAFEGVAAGSGPWIIPNTGQLSNVMVGPAEDWLQVCWQGPSASGVGIEVWAAIQESGTQQGATFTAAQNVVGVAAAWSGEYNPTGNITPATVRLAPTQGVVGNAPAAPAVVANVGELIIACGGDTMSAGGFGSPSGYTNRIDARRSGAGTVEAALADATAQFAGNTGPITFPNAASASTAYGSTATLVVRPVPTVGGVGGVMEAPLPPDLVVPGGWTFRFSAIDATTGVTVPGVLVSEANIVATDTSGGDGGGGDAGPYMLVPGPDA